MADQWIVLTPPGVTVDVRESPKVTRPLLVTVEDLQTLLGIVSAPATKAPVVPSQAELYGCVCGQHFGGGVDLARHQLNCGLHRNGFMIPLEHRVE